MDGLVTIHRDHVEFFSPTQSRWCVIQRPTVLPGSVIRLQSHRHRASCEIMQPRTRRKTTPVVCNSIANSNFIARREPDLSSFLLVNSFFKRKRRVSTTIYWRDLLM